MKNILHINTTKGGGAYVAARRWSELANKIDGNISSQLLTLEGTSAEGSLGLSESMRIEYLAKINHLSEKAYFSAFQKDSSVRFQYSIPKFGIDITRHPAVLAADIIHLHWINKGFFSNKSLRKLLALGKPVFWTMHDMWPMTGGCHHSRGCANFKNTCGNCEQYLKNPQKEDLSYRIWSEKKSVYRENNLTFIAPSKWLYELACSSSLLSSHYKLHIPNPIDTNIFRPMKINGLREKFNLPLDKKMLLFVAASISNPYKGFDYFKEALKKIDCANIAIGLVGDIKTEINFDVDIEVVKLGYISDEQTMVELYNCSDLFVTTSLEENLPNTIIEAMSCGVPVVAFDVGGISDIIDHNINGHLCDIYNSNSVASSISKILSDNLMVTQFRIACRKKILNLFSYDALIQNFRDLYGELYTIE